MAAINYTVGMDHPELIAVCMNCDKPDCAYVCERYREKWASLFRAEDGQTQKPGRKAKHYSNGHESHTIKEWAVILGITRVAMHMRLKRNPKTAFRPGRRGVNIDGKRIIPIEYHGETVSCTELARRAGMNRNTMNARIIVNGWDPDEAMNTPVRRKRRKTNENHAG